ncbi:MAG: ATP-dependent helicase, partial [Atopostipes suicloacalis]|nr:ATP-dependent helicase [Atopostipes suicloacalis]
YWKNGYIDHEDILFFSYILIKNYPFLLTVLRAKYPYFFVDEFQDTSPVQAFIIDEIKKKKCVVGVIGDKAQSIYGFQGAQVSLFEDFKVDQTNFHVISENRRSAYQIVTFLNEIRKDIKQRQYHKKENSPVSILIGERNKAFFKANNDCNGELTSLSRDNITSNAMKRDIEENRLDKKLLDKFRETDGNNRRKNFILGLIQAVELAVNTKYKEAIKEIEYLYKGNEDSKKQALYILSNLINQYNQFEQGTLKEFYNILDGVLDESLPGFKKGKPKDFYENTMYHDLAICAVNIVEDVSKHITIHKAKGSEFENVLVIGNKDALNLLKQPDLENNEEQRIFYVAMSRAKERLFVQFDNLRDEDEKVIKKFYDIDIIRLN